MPVINFRHAQFQLAAPSLKHCPPETGAEVAFAGRSNAGKSSAINALTHNKKLARTSKTPGRTQLINFFKLDDEAQIRIADLPGYGYAKVPLAKKKEWQANLTEYLYERRCLQGLILLMDIRHPLQEFDRQMLEWTHSVNMPTHVLLTKSDKLKRGPAKSTMLSVHKEILAMSPDRPLSVQTFSATNQDGMKELERVLKGWLTIDNEETSDAYPPEGAD